LLIISDHVGGVERERVVVLADALLNAITNPPEGGCTIEGTSPSQGARKLLELEVRRNEVQLRVHSEGEQGWDVAVGLDDFQDALEGIVGA
jgi:hypothetical protein